MKNFQIYIRVNTQWMEKKLKECEKEHNLWETQGKLIYMYVFRKIEYLRNARKNGCKDERKEGGKDREIMLRC